MDGLTLEKLQVIIEAYTEPYRKELEKVKIQTSTTAAHVERQTKKMEGSFKKVAGVLAGLVSVGALAAFTKSCLRLGSDLAEVQNVVDVTFGEMSGQVDAFSKNAATQFGLSETMTKKYMGTYGAMAKSFGITGQAGIEMSKAITGLTGDVASFYNLTQDEAYTKLKSIFTGETESLKDLGVVMTQTALDQYALNNGFGRTTAKMTEQEKVMLRYQFVMSSLADASGDFSRTSGSWANQVKMLALQFESLKATIGQGLINAFTPVIRAVNTLLAKLQTLANYFRAFTTALFGSAGSGGDASEATAASMSRAAGSSGAVADNMGKAAGAAKRMKEYTLGIDELNVLSPESESGGGSSGGGGGEAPDFGSMGGELFGDVTVNPEIDEALERMKELLEHLREAAKPTTDAIKRLWNEGLSKLGAFTWTALEDFWNYFLKPLGNWVLGEGFPQLINIMNDFLEKIKWDKINEALRNFWKALEPFAENVGRGLLNFYRDLMEFGAGFINIVVPGGLNGLAKALDSIDAEHAEKIGYALGMIASTLTGLKIVGGIAEGIKRLGKAIIGFPGVKVIAGLFSGEGLLMGLQNLYIGLGGMGTASFDAIVYGILDQFISSLDRLLPDWATKFLGNLGAGIAFGAVAGSWFPGAGTVAGAIIGGIIGALNGITIDGKSILKTIGEKIFNWDSTQSIFQIAFDCFKNAFSGDKKWYKIGLDIIKGIASGFLGFATIFLEPIHDFFSWVAETICNIFGIHSPAESMKPYGEYILLGIIEGFKDTFSAWTEALEEWYTTYIAPWFTSERWSMLYDSIKQQLKAKWNETVVVWSQGVQNWWGEHVAPWFTSQRWSELYDTIKSQLKEKWDETAKRWIDNISRWWSKNVAPWFTVKKWSDLYDSIKSQLKQKWGETLSNWISDLTVWWEEHVAPWFTVKRWSDLYESIKSQLAQKWSETLGEWQSNLALWWSNDVLPWFTLDKWLGIFENIKTSLKTTWDNTSGQWVTDIGVWWDTNVSPWFTLEKWKEMMSKVPTAFTDIFKGAVNAARDQLNRLIDWVNDKLNISFDGLEIAGEEVIPGFNVQLFTIPHIPAFADGGIINSGQLFLAREAGPELVGSYGGKTGVLNNKQIVDAVSDGVATAVSKVMSSQGQTPDKVEVKLVVDGRTLADVVTNANRRNGFKFRPV